MNYDLIVHVDLDSRPILDLALGNIGNYLNALTEEMFRVALVANGPAVTLFANPDDALRETLASLKAEGVSFKVCANALRKFGVEQASLPKACEVVPAGVVEIVRLQRNGYAYIKP